MWVIVSIGGGGEKWDFLYNQGYLPAVSMRPEKEQKAPVSLESFRGRGEQVLLVEDEEPVREFTERALSESGYIVFTAADAQEALDIFEKEESNFDLEFAQSISS